MNSLKPWARGPFELIEHAEELRKLGKDRDKRIALVLYDNSIEASIITYLGLHPSQRNGFNYQNREVDQWLHNYHTKLDFFYDHVKKLDIPVKVTKDVVVWYHNHRNELYHSGKGMVPAEYNLDGTREAALWVFSVLFEVDGEALLYVERPVPSLPPRSYRSSTEDFPVQHRKPINPEKPGTLWTPLSKFTDTTIIPNRIKFPDGAIALTNSQGMKVLRQVGEWLVRTKKPLPSTVNDYFGRNRPLLSDKPMYTDPRRYQVLSNGWYVDTQHTASGCVRNAIWLIQQAGENPDDYFFQ